MADFKLNAQGDLDLASGGLALTNDANGETVEQRLRVRLRLFAGEWFLDNRLGVPYYSLILVKQPDLGAVESALRSVLLETPGVASLLTYNQRFDAEARALSVEFSVRTDSGDTLDLQEELN